MRSRKRKIIEKHIDAYAKAVRTAIKKGLVIPSCTYSRMAARLARQLQAE